MICTTRTLFALIGQGYKIRAPKNGGQAEIVPMIPDPNARRLTWIEDRNEQRLPVSKDLINRLEYEKQIFKLYETNHGRPNTRLGWKDMGLDGGVADWYVMTQ